MEHGLISWIYVWTKKFNAKKFHSLQQFIAIASWCLKLTIKLSLLSLFSSSRIFSFADPETVNSDPSHAGYAIYEMLGTTERCILMEEVLADVMSRWEHYRQSSAASLHQHHHIFLFKVTSGRDIPSSSNIWPQEFYVWISYCWFSLFTEWQSLNSDVYSSIPQKHLLLESWIDLSDNVEKELLYFQVLYTLRADKFPVKQVEAVSDDGSS